jgi:hypothetical protein
MDTLTELRQLADDLTALGDHATAALVHKALDHFARWEFEAGERWLERRWKHEQPDRPRSPNFNTCALVTA